MAAATVESTLVQRFHLASAPTLEARVSGAAPIVFSRIRAELPQPGRSLSPTPEAAFTFQIPLIPASFSELKFGNKSVALPEIQEPGRVFLFDLSERPTVGLNTKFDNVRCYMTQAAIDDLAYDRGLKRIGGLVQKSCGERDPVMFHLAKLLVPALDSPRTVSSAFIKYIALAVHEHVIRMYGGVSASEPKCTGGLAPWQVRRVVEFIEAHIDGDPTIANLSRECQLSESYFVRAFRRSIGMAPHRWIMKRRIERAKLLMCSSAYGLAEIANMCGFVDQSHLGRVFAREIGMSPANWRRCQE